MKHAESKKITCSFIIILKKQSGGRLQRARDLPLNILKRGTITFYSVNFDQYKDFYDFHSSDIIVFLDNVHLVFNSQNDMYTFQGYFEIINQQRGPEFVLEDKRKSGTT